MLETLSCNDGPSFLWKCNFSLKLKKHCTFSGASIPSTSNHVMTTGPLHLEALLVVFILAFQYVQQKEILFGMHEGGVLGVP